MAKVYGRAGHPSFIPAQFPQGCGPIRAGCTLSIIGGHHHWAALPDSATMFVIHQLVLCACEMMLLWDLCAGRSCGIASETLTGRTFWGVRIQVVSTCKGGGWRFCQLRLFLSKASISQMRNLYGGPRAGAVCCPSVAAFCTSPRLFTTASCCHSSSAFGW